MSVRNYSFLIICCCLLSCNSENTFESYVAFGDSHINKFDFDYYFPGQHILNNGINGLTIEEVEIEIANYQGDQDHLILHIGTNDHIKAENKNLSEFEFLAAFKEDLESLISILIDYEQVIVIGSLPVSQDYLEEISTYDFQKVEDLWLEVLENKNQFQFISSNILWEENNLLDPIYSTDLIHLNEFAYTKLTAEIYGKMD